MRWSYDWWVLGVSNSVRKRSNDDALSHELVSRLLYQSPRISYRAKGVIVDYVKSLYWVGHTRRRGRGVHMWLYEGACGLCGEFRAGIFVCDVEESEQRKCWT